MTRDWRLAWVLGVAWLTSACTRWQVIPIPTAVRLVTDSAPGLVRVTRADGSRMELEQPRIAGDTLTGTLSYTGRAAERVAIPLDSVARIARKTSDPSGSKKGLVIGFFLALGFLGWMVILD